MAYTKTNLNETTETVAVDMAAEGIENNETTETVVEQNARGYSKTVWNESTPITADKLNKMETGIANAIDKKEQVMEIPITNSDGWQQFRWISSKYDTVSWTRDAKAKKAIEIFNESTPKQLLLLTDSGNLTTAGSITLPNSTKGQIKHMLTDGTATETVYITTNNNLRLGSADIEKVYLYSKATPAAVVNGTTYALYHTGNKPSANDVGALPLTGGTITGTVNFNSSPKLSNDKYINALDTSGTSKSVLGITVNDNCIVGSPDLTLRLRTNDATGASVYYNSKAYPIYHTGNKPTAKDVGALPIDGGTLKGGLGINGGKLTFSKQIGGGQMSSLINCQELQNNTGNGQMMTAYNNTIYVGNPDTQLYLESRNNPILVRNGVDFTLYHTGNKPTPWDIGAMTTDNPTFQGNLYQNGPGGKDWIYHINADMGTLNIAPRNNGNPDWSKQILFDRNGQLFCNGGKRVATWDGNNPSHYMFRYGSGLGGANGYITFSY